MTARNEGEPDIIFSYQQEQHPLQTNVQPGGGHYGEGVHGRDVHLSHLDQDGHQGPTGGRVRLPPLAEERDRAQHHLRHPHLESEGGECLGEAHRWSHDWSSTRWQQLYQRQPLHQLPAHPHERRLGEGGEGGQGGEEAPQVQRRRQRPLLRPAGQPRLPLEGGDEQGLSGDDAISAISTTVILSLFSHPA